VTHCFHPICALIQSFPFGVHADRNYAPAFAGTTAWRLEPNSPHVFCDVSVGLWHRPWGIDITS
jgi:hypothetical protein